MDSVCPIRSHQVVLSLGYTRNMLPAVLATSLGQQFNTAHVQNRLSSFAKLAFGLSLFGRQLCNCPSNGDIASQQKLK